MRVATLLILLVSLSGTAEAKVATPTLGELKARADVVALVDVVAIHTVAGLKFAEARVVKSYKGSAKVKQTVVYLVDRTWACDVSNGAKGERAIVFLEVLPAKVSKLRGKQSPEMHAALDATFGAGVARYRISTAGRGRLQVKGGQVTRGIVRWPFGASASLAQVEARL